MRKIVEYCKDSGIPFKTVPGYGELIDGRVSVKAIRDVAYPDLLGETVVKLDEKGISDYIEGNCMLVTGAGGSIGSELCRQICRFNPKKLCYSKGPKVRFMRLNSSSNGISTIFALSRCWVTFRAASSWRIRLNAHTLKRSFTRLHTSMFPCWKFNPGRPSRITF